MTAALVNQVLQRFCAVNFSAPRGPDVRVSKRIKRESARGRTELLKAAGCRNGAKYCTREYNLRHSVLVPEQ